jgi:hypothetical protein
MPESVEIDDSTTERDHEREFTVFLTISTVPESPLILFKSVLRFQESEYTTPESEERFQFVIKSSHERDQTLELSVINPFDKVLTTPERLTTAQDK